MNAQTYTAESIDNADDYSVALASNVTLAAAQAAAQADDDDYRINGLISDTRALEWRTTADGFEANGVDTLRYVLTPYNAKLAELESLLPFYLQPIASWPFSNDGRWPSVVVNDASLTTKMALLNIVVPLPTLLRADNVERLANVMLALSTNELDAFVCAGQRWHIGDGDDTQAAWLADGKLHIWLRSWPQQQEQQSAGSNKMSNRKTHTFETNEAITPAMLADAAIVAQACFIPACVTCSHDAPRADAFIVAADANVLHVDADTNDGNLLSTIGEIVRAIGEMNEPTKQREMMNALVVFGAWLEQLSGESADAIQQGENSDAIFYVLISEADGEQMKLHGMFATSALAQAHAAMLVSDTYGSDATPLEWHSFDGGSEAEFNDDCGAWRFIALWHFSADVPA